ncbi:MBL fold metallo-hydrolase [Nakamurella endophytica]|uniref:Nudix hydrolase domain-containing protein n=1 Tax=Nakamurella endophytica TaxID=1748367 RepID=A0A917T1A7_9ACTN|nr:MBL fold metallo-hydrolase [Nakamurella endophytica]GGM05452.1 hypothetical protein GCM10011594_27100 [Nakamurella endophytica]
MTPAGAPPDAVRPAATVVLTRDGSAGLEVFVLRRVPSMVFAPGTTVFPGGAVDPTDRLPVRRWAGPPPSWWRDALGAADAADAAALLVAAVRELFEETGVLLAGAAADGPVTGLPAGADAVRDGLATHRTGLPDVLAAAERWLRTDLLRPLARWITPPGPPRRYDTAFLLARLPAGQDARVLTTEADQGRWARPVDLLAEAASGGIRLLPPTRAVLLELAGTSSLADLLAVQRAVPVGPGAPDGDDGDGPVPPGARRVTALATRVLAPNPGPMTLDGTNSYLVRAPGAATAVVVDPGPDDAGHLDRLVEGAGGRIELVLITHRHPDHTAGVDDLVARTGAPVRAVDPAWCRRSDPLRHGELLQVAGTVIEVVATPGHTDDSACFLLPHDVLWPGGGATGADARAGSVLTGDTVLGRGTTVLAHPDGRVADYLASLDRLAALDAGPALPAHGPVLPDLAAACRRYARHRRERLDQVRAALDSLGPAADADAVVAAVYPDVDPAVRYAAVLSVQAQLEYLRA